MMRFVKGLGILLIAIIFNGFVSIADSLGMQKFVVTDGDVIKVKFSAREITRIAVKGGRIEKLWGSAGIFETQTDKKEGDLFLRATAAAANAVSFFVRDSFGSTYTIIAEQEDIPSQTIILAPTNRSSKVERERFKNRPLIISIKELVKIMVQDGKKSGGDQNRYEVSEVNNEEIKLWKEAKLVHLKTYRMEKLLGEVFELKNTSKEEMQLTESEFLNFRPNILAVAIEMLGLKQNEVTKIYIIRNR